MRQWARLILLVIGAVLLWACLCAIFFTGIRWIDLPVELAAGAFALLFFAVRIKPAPPPRDVVADIQRMRDEAILPPGSLGPGSAAARPPR